MKLILSITLQFIFIGQILAITPDRSYQITPDSLGLNYESVTIQTPDKTQIKVWHINASEESNNGNTIILCYGDAGNMSYWLNQAGILSQVGYSVVLFDYRGFGESSDFEINPNQLYYNEFATDLECVIKWSKQNLSYKKLGLLSFSMGTIMSTIAIQTEPVDFMIAEGYVLNPKSIKKKIFELKNKKILLPKNSKNYESLISKIDIPILVFSGTNDIVTTTKDSEKIVAQKSNRQLITFDGNHLEGFQKLTKNYFGDMYIESITNFIEKECR